MKHPQILKALTLASALIAAPVFAEVKIAVVDFSEVAAKSPQADAIREKLKKEFNDRIENIKKQEAELKALQDKLQKDGPTMTEQQKIDGQRNLQTKGQDYQTKAKFLDDDMKRRQSEEGRGLEQKVYAVINAVAQKEGYTVVLDKRTIHYFQPHLDITALVISQLGSPAPATTPAKPAGK